MYVIESDFQKETKGLVRWQWTILLLKSKSKDKAIKMILSHITTPFASHIIKYSIFNIHKHHFIQNL